MEYETIRDTNASSQSGVYVHMHPVVSIQITKRRGHLVNTPALR
jgi:hypothetical protein